MQSASSSFAIRRGYRLLDSSRSTMGGRITIDTPDSKTNPTPMTARTRKRIMQAKDGAQTQTGCASLLEMRNFHRSPCSLHESRFINANNGNAAAQRLYLCVLAQAHEWERLRRPLGEAHSRVLEVERTAIIVPAWRRQQSAELRRGIEPPSRREGGPSSGAVEEVDEQRVRQWTNADPDRFVGNGCCAIHRAPALSSLSFEWRTAISQ